VWRAKLTKDFEMTILEMTSSEMEIEKSEIWNGPSRPPYTHYTHYTHMLSAHVHNLAQYIGKGCQL
jgi:hypothetical protein